MKDLRCYYLNTVNNKVNFGFQKNSQPVSSRTLVAQRVIKTLFTKPGSNIWHPEEGTMLANLIGQAHDKKDENSLRTIIKISLSQVEKFIKTQQLSNLSLLKDSEKLQSIELLDVTFDGSLVGFKIAIKITTLDGTSFFIGV